MNALERATSTASKPPAALLETRALRKSYGGVRALRNGDFTAYGGEVHALLGENGAGKSTFIKMLTGAIVPEAGEIHLEGQLLPKLTPALASAHGIAAVFQELSLVPVLTGAENLEFPSEKLTRWRSRARRTMRADGAALMERLGFDGVPLDVPVSQLSVGQRQLLEIAKAVASNPKVLILDEATSALGQADVERVRAVARAVADRGGLCIYISHRLAEIRAVADRVTVFRGGETVASLDVADQTDDDIVEHIVGQRVNRLYPEPSTRTQGEVVLRARGLRVGHALRGVDIDLHRGEILGVGGLQGQGQLELFQRLFGAVRGDGEIEIGGRPTRVSSPRHALRAGIGCAFIPEDRKREGLLLAKSVRENLALPRLDEVSRFGWLDRAREKALVNDSIERFQIALRDPEQNAGTLSGGNQQKVVIGKFMIPGVEIVLWYDPTRGIDIGAKREIFDLMQLQAANGRAALFFSTEADELINLCDRVLVLAGGTITTILEKHELSESALMRASLAIQEAA